MQSCCFLASWLLLLLLLGLMSLDASLIFFLGSRDTLLGGLARFPGRGDNNLYTTNTDGQSVRIWELEVQKISH